MILIIKMCKKLICNKLSIDLPPAGIPSQIPSTGTITSSSDDFIALDSDEYAEYQKNQLYKKYNIDPNNDNPNTL